MVPAPSLPQFPHVYNAREFRRPPPHVLVTGVNEGPQAGSFSLSQTTSKSAFWGWGSGLDILGGEEGPGDSCQGRSNAGLSRALSPSALPAPCVARDPL